MMSSEHSIKKPITYLVVGGFLIYLPSAIQTGISTLWNTPYPTAYLTNANTASSWQLVINNSFTILQLIGVIAFIRGLIILTQLGGHGGQPGTFWKGMTHIIGGILCINMYDTVRMIGATLGLTGVLGSLN
jgi:intracellular multiplication protein IcmC